VALGVAGTAAVSAGTVGIASTSWFAKIGWTKLLFGVSAIGAVATLPLGYQAWQHHNVRSTAQSSMPRAPEVATRVQSTGNLGVNSAVKSEGTPVEVTSPSSVQGAGVPKSSVTVSRTDTPAPGLAEELASLDSARALLARGDAQGALARLDAYARAYPKGRLQLEAEVMRIDALTKSGQTGAAKKRAEAFLRKYPNSVLASRVRALLGS
jgi:TolA-binding protein